MTRHICITFTTTTLGLHIYDYYSSNSSTSKHTHLTGVITSFCRQSTRAWASDRQSGQVSHRCQCIRTDSLDMCVCSVVYALSRKFSLFSLSKRYYIVQYRRKKIRFRAVTTVSCSAAILCHCCGDLSPFTTCSRYFSLHFLL